MILVDTCYIIDLLRKRVEASSLENYIEEILFVSEITTFELFFGIYSNKALAADIDLQRERVDRINQLLSKFQLLQFDRAAAIEAAKLLGSLQLRGLKIEFRDGLIAGTGLAHGIKKILTRNVSHFDRIPSLSICQYGIM